ncbi:MAG: beta-lactamase family protein [Pyrinomonadaceae bacterium]|nr:beta-lactamase family protein [Pyrinomonadaceae bacterium]
MQLFKSFITLLLLAIISNAQVKIADNLTKELNEFRKTSLIPGFAVSIVNENGVLYSKGFGLANIKENKAFTPLTINWIASVSKTFVALSFMKLVEQGKLDLDAPINSILPYKIVNPHYPNAPITVRHLVTHTSSIIDSFEPYSVGEADVVLENDNDSTKVPAYLQPNVDWHKMSKKISLDENIRKYTQPKAKWYSEDSFLKKEPGTHFQYSNLASSIAARIVEEKSGMSFAAFTKKYIFEPLGMKNTAWNFADLNPKLVSKIYVQNDEKKPTGAAEYPQYYMTNYPVSGLKTNISDLAKYLIEMIKGSDGKGKLLNNKTYKMLFEPQMNAKYLPKLDAESLNNKENMSIFWSINKDGEYYHLGGNIGVYSFIKFNPKTKTGSLAFCNLRDDSFGDIQTIVYKHEQKTNKK